MIKIMFMEFFVGMWRHWLRWKTVRQLSLLSERGLKDIGLDRSEIESVATDLSAKCNGSRVRNRRCQDPMVANVTSDNTSTG